MNTFERGLIGGIILLVLLGYAGTLVSTLKIWQTKQQQILRAAEGRRVVVVLCDKPWLSPQEEKFACAIEEAQRAPYRSRSKYDH